MQIFNITSLIISLAILYSVIASIFDPPFIISWLMYMILFVIYTYFILLGKIIARDDTRFETRNKHMHHKDLDIPNDVVVFTAHAPRWVAPSAKFVLDIWACLKDQLVTVAELARGESVGQKMGVPIERGTLITISLDIPDLAVRDPVDHLVWCGEPANASFQITVPKHLSHGDYLGTAKIAASGIPIARIDLGLSITNEVYPETPAEFKRRITIASRTKTAFASYASEDRAEVLSRIQGMKKIAPDLDIFIDSISLRAGDDWKQQLESVVPNRDTFFLFWSRFAKESAWVEREWKLALAKRGIDYIDPVPLVDPDIVPPPRRLRKLHFGDAYLAYIEYQRSKESAANSG